MSKDYCSVIFFRLDIGYVDLYLIHSPSGGDILRTYDAMLELKAQGLIRFGVEFCDAFHFRCFR